MRLPRGIGVEPETPGHLFVADSGNSRVDELDVWGQFKRTWGWEVVASGPDDEPPVNAKQELTVSATVGSFKLRYFNAYDVNPLRQTTVPIPFNASAAEVKAALVELASLEEGDVVVSGGPGDAGGSSPYEIEFTGNYANTAIPQLVIKESTLSGGSEASLQTLAEGGSFEVCVPTSGDVCRRGQGGGYGPGGFWLESPGGMAVDGSGGVYAFEIVPGGAEEEKSFRVQKFDSEGHFLLMWGGEVNKTTHVDRCTATDVEGGDVCGAGAPGTAPGRFEDGTGIAIGPEGNVFVGDKERIQKFDTEGHYLGEVAIPSKTVRALALDSSGNFYVSYVGENDVRKVSPAGIEAPSPTFAGRQPIVAVAVGASGRVYLNEFPLIGPSRILGYEPNGTCFICPADEFHATAATEPVGLARSEACGVESEDLYASFSGGEAFVRAYGPQPDPTIPGCEPPEVPPSIEDQYAASVSTEGAVLKAVFNPHFWSGPVLGPTTYYVQYASAACLEAGGWGAECVQAKPAPPGETLEAEAVSIPVASAPISLGGLKPATAYRYRFVAESPGGGPVFGKGGTAGSDGAEGSFTTFAPPPGAQGPCENEAFRSGPTALLPDCRAYEMVSPVEKENGDIFTTTDGNGDPIALNQSSADGDAFTYSSSRAFGDAQGAPISSQYMARRGPRGWSSEALDPPRGPAYLEIIKSLNNAFKAFSPDLCTAWVFHEDESPTLAPGAVEGFANLYRRQECGPEAGSYEALTTIAPPNRPRDFYIPELLGMSADGSRAIFRAADALPGTGAPAGDPGPKGFDLYEAFGEGQLRFVCRRPNGTAVSGGCTAGTGQQNQISYGRELTIDHAFSEDGKRIFWSDVPEGRGRLFVRIEGKKTVQLSSDPTQYWTAAAADGSAALFTTGALAEGKAALHRYDVDEEEDDVIAEKVYGVMGASDDVGRIYFASGEVLDEGAEAGKPNLYLWQGGDTPSFTFIAMLAGEDVTGGYSPLNTEPDRHAAQVTADGLSAAFMSTAPLTGRDNIDLVSGKADAEIFHYDAASEQLICASCNPTNARPPGREPFENSWMASRIPGAQTDIYPVPRVLSDDGSKLFFESFQPLIASDTDGSADVYEWERPGEGNCTTSIPAYSPTAGGCVSLISSGKSPADSLIADVSPSGRDVFLATASRLLPKSDPDELYDVYDARAGGGFPPPAEAPAPCEGEACQSPPPAPPAASLASSAYEGPGNPTQGKPRRCAKGKHLVRRGARKRCVKRAAKKAHHQRRTHRNRRAAR